MEFEVEGKTYRSGKLDAFKQLHIARRLAPLIAKLAPEVGKEGADFFGLMSPVIDGLAAMPEEDVNYVTERCLAVVQRRQGDAWAPVWHDGTKRMFFEDIDAMGILVISFHVIQENLGNFMRAPALGSASQSQTDSASPANLSNFPTMRVG